MQKVSPYNCIFDIFNNILNHICQRMANYDEKEFQERSDFIEDNDLESWNVSNSHFDYIQQKLLGVGAKLFAGPRGTGKTHQMKIAHLKCLHDQAKPLSIFVSFSKYYHLEPFLTKVPNAQQVFHTWVLAKIVLGCYSVISELPDNPKFVNFEKANMLPEIISEYVEKAEKLKAAQLNNDPLISVLTISKTISLIESIAQYYKRKRVVLMLDDAALTLTPEYLIEFFDIVRSLKTKVISPKASVYPGTTQYGPRFHIGQDAEMVQCWLSVETPTYSEFMDSLIKQRFLQYTQTVNSEIIELFKYASFGVPRAFISLLRNFTNNKNDKSIFARFNSAIAQQARFIETEYLSIAQKLVQYKKVIETGFRFFIKITDEIKSDNQALVQEKNITIGISSESIVNTKLAERMFRFLIEAGLLYEDAPVKHGVQKENAAKREYKRFIPHVLFLIQNRTFSEGRSSSFSDSLNNLALKSRKHPLRRSISNLLTSSEIGGLALDLPPCSVCNTPRLNAEQKFCHTCGNKLVNQSAFEHCMQISLADIPITEWQKERLEGINLKTVGDVMSLQQPGTELRKIRQIGKVRSQKIYDEVLRTVEEFLA